MATLARINKCHTLPLREKSTMDAKTCSTCLQRRPISDFRLRRKHGSARRPECRKCHSAKECLRGAIHRSASKQKAMREFWQQVTTAKNARRVESLVQAVIADFGGIDRVSRAWVETLQNSMSSGRHNTAMKGFLAVATMMKCE